MDKNDGQNIDEIKELISTKTQEYCTIVDNIKKDSITELMSFSKIPQRLTDVLSSTLSLLGIPESQFGPVKTILAGQVYQFVKQLKEIKIESIPKLSLESSETLMSQPNVTPGELNKISVFGEAMCKYNLLVIEIWKLLQQLDKLKNQEAK